MVLLAFAVLAPVAILLSEMPRLAAWPAALASCLYATRCAQREARRPPIGLVIVPNADGATVDGRPVRAMQVSWRGPLAFLRWRDEADRTQRLAFWPDTLPPPQRRELRLAAPATVAARSSASVAP